MRTAYFVTFIALVFIAGSGYIVAALANHFNEIEHQRILKEFHRELELRDLCRSAWPKGGENFDKCISQSPRN